VVPGRGRLFDPPGVRCIGHHIEHVVGQPPHDDVVDDRSVGVVEQVRVLGPPRADPAEVVRQGGLEAVECAGPFDPDGAQVAHIEDHRVLATGTVLGQGALRIGERHLPPAEPDQLRPQPPVGIDQGGVQERIGAFGIRMIAERRRGVGHVQEVTGAGPQAVRATPCEPPSPARPYLARRARVSL
jgi:hypothetical protein